MMDYPRSPRVEGAAARNSTAPPSSEFRTSSPLASSTTDGLPTTDGLSAPVSGEPTAATNIITFDGEEHGPAVIRYNLPLPGQHTGQRIVRLDLTDLGLADADINTESLSVPKSIKALGWQKPENSPTWTYDPDRAIDLFLERLSDAGWPSPRPRPDPDQQAVGRYFFELQVRREPRKSDGTLAVPKDWPPEIGFPEGPDAANYLRIRDSFYTKFVDGLLIGQLSLPVKSWQGNVGSIEITTTTAEEALGKKGATFLLIETYGISAFLGDYGLGRTVRTFSLLPGEETKISIKTWRSTSEKVAEASSIVDSLDQKAVERFTNTVQRETTDKANRMNKVGWHVEAEAQASFGFGSAKVSGGAQGEYQAAREQFAKQVDNAVQEHTGEASSARDTTVTSSTETTETTGEETLTERTIRNVNLRRVLNFVFRELNQEYITKIHLTDIKLAFYNGATNSLRVVPLPGLRGLLEEVLQAPEQKINEAASRILGVAGTVMDKDDNPVSTLDRLTLQSDGTYKKADAVWDSTTEKFPAPPKDRSFLYRFKPSYLGQNDEKNPHHVQGVVLKESTITMRTDSFVIEALLGQADALDSYAMVSQRAEAEAKWLANRRQDLALNTLEKITDPKERAAAYAQMFNPPLSPARADAGERSLMGSR